MENWKIVSSVNMSMAFAIVLIAFSLRSVEGATCSNLTSSSCEESDLTEATCDSANTCGCKDGFPIPTGCSKKITKPNVILSDPSRTSIIASKAAATLVCSTTVEETGSLNYEWNVNKVKSDTKTKEYTIASFNDSNVGLYSCRVKYGDIYASDESDPLNVTLLSDASILNLTLAGVPNSAAAGSTYTATCMGMPVGVNSSFNVASKQPVNPISVEDAGNITCSYGNEVSDPMSTPTIVSDITGVEVSVEGAVGADFIYRIGTNVTVSCMSKPSDIYMDVGSATVNYTITDVTTSEVYNSQSYTPDSTGSHTVFCSASYNGSATKISTRVTVVFMDNYITPVLNHYGNELLEGSRLVLSCSAGTGVSYTWTRNDEPIPLQYDRLIQFDNITKNDVGIFSCTAQKGNYIAQSNTVNITIVDEVSQPTIYRTDGEKEFYEGENYQLECRTASATKGMKYAWERGNTTIANAVASLYNLTNVVASTVNGNYSCEVTFQNTTAQSVAFTVIAGDAVPGKPCSVATAKTDCSGKEYKGTCTKNKLFRCDCANGYRQNKKTCEKSRVQVLTSSALVVLLGVIFARMMSAMP